MARLTFEEFAKQYVENEPSDFDLTILTDMAKTWDAARKKLAEEILKAHEEHKSYNAIIDIVRKATKPITEDKS